MNVAIPDVVEHESARGDVSSEGQLVIQFHTLVPCHQATDTTEFSILIESSWMGGSFPGIEKVQSCPDIASGDTCTERFRDVKEGSIH